MKFRAIYQHASNLAQSPVRVVEHTTGREIGWINRYLDREYVRRLADTTLRIYAHNLLHFIRWWEGVHHTGDIVESDLAESTLLDYLRFQSSRQPRPSGSTINDRIAVADRALRNEFPDAPCQIARGFHQAFLRRGPMGLGRPRTATSRVRVKVAKRNIVPLSVDEVARFWSSFRTSRDLAIVGLMLLQGLRSAEVLALNRDDILLSEAQFRVRGKGSKLRFLPLAPESVQLVDHYLRLERPDPCSAALFVSLKGRSRGARMTAAGLRSLFRYHRRTTGVTLANPHRFRHYAEFRTMPSKSLLVQRQPGMTAIARAQVTGELGIVRGWLQALEESQQFVVGPITTSIFRFRHGCRLGKRLFLEREIRIKVDLRRLDRFVPEPKCDHRSVNPRLQEFHRRRVAKNMRCHSFLLQ